MNKEEILQMNREELYDVFLFYVTMHMEESVELVAELEKTVRYATRKPIFLAMYFPLLVKRNRLDEMKQIIEEIREDLYQINILHKESPIGRLTVSGGVAILVKKHKISKSDLMRWADISLYQAKNTGENKVVVKLVEGRETIPNGVLSPLSVDCI